MVGIKKKRVIGVCILIILYSIIYMGLRDNQRQKFNNMKSYEKQMKIDKFVSEHKGKEPEINQQVNNDGGYDGIMVVNKQELLQVVNVDKMLIIGEQLRVSTEDIINLYNEYKCSDIENYFNDNKEEIINVTGINSSEQFKSFINKVSELEEDNKRISKVKIKEGSIVKNDNSVDLNVLLLNDDEVERSFIVTINDIHNDDKVTLFWK